MEAVPAPVSVRIRVARAKIDKITPKTIHFINLLKSSPLKFWKIKSIKRDIYWDSFIYFKTLIN
jgi:hypothetical protein